MTRLEIILGNTPNSITLTHLEDGIVEKVKYFFHFTALLYQKPGQTSYKIRYFHGPPFTIKHDIVFANTITKIIKAPFSSTWN